MKKIFILEDSRIVSELLKFQFEEEFPCKVECFEHGAHLMSALSENPDLIILDYFIDGDGEKNGMTVLREIKQVNLALPVIIFSGQHNFKTAIELINQGATDYIDKNQEGFLEEMNVAVKNILRFKDTEYELVRAEQQLDKQKKRFFKHGLVSLLLLYFMYLFI